MTDDPQAPELPPPPPPPRAADVPRLPPPPPAPTPTTIRPPLEPSWSRTASPAAAPVRRSAMRGTVMALVAVCVLGGVWIVARSGDERDAARPSSAASTGFPIETAAFRFVLPSEPRVEPIETDVMGLALAGTAWQIGGDDQLLQVLAIEWPQPLDDEVAQTSFDGSIGGLARRIGGTVVSDEALEVDGVTQRITRIDFDGGIIHVHAFAVGTWTVSIEAGYGNDNPRPPAEFDAVVASFEFTV